MKRMKLLLSVMILVSINGMAQALKVGDQAPELKVGAWVKGNPIAQFDKDKIYVMEFWATWCGPCKSAIPHLTMLASKYKGKVEIIGISVWEKNTDDVVPFVKKMDVSMNYAVAIDFQSSPTIGIGFMAKRWLRAADISGIPATCIVGKSGKIEYIGNASPDEIEKELKRLLSGYKIRP